MDQGIETPLGRYRLIALLGQGGMADVYLACTKGPGGFQKMLVVKVARFTGEPMFSTMFLDEARIAAQLEHPNVIQTFEVGEEGSRHYIVMEYLDGANLARLRNRAKKVGGVPLRTSIHVLHQVLEGLAYAHEARGIDGTLLRVVHRDLTPSNIIITTQGVVKILDFGIAKAVDTQSFTQTGHYSGKLSYMPPEQLRVESVDGRADIFSVGVILAEAVLGERFWGDATGEQIALQLRVGHLPDLDRYPDLDPEMRRILGCALAPDRDQRYPNASVFKADMLRYLNTLGGPLPREELGDFVNAVTYDDRKKLKLAIDTQMQRISQVSLTQTPPPDLPILEMTPSDRSLHSARTAPLHEETKRDDHEIVIEGVDPATPPALPKHPRSARGRRLALATGAVLALGLGAGFSVIMQRTDDTPKPGIPAQPVAHPVRARLEVLVSPPDAVLELDGKPLETNPYAGSWPRDMQLHELVVTAAGFEPQTRHFTLESDLTLQLRLEPTKVAMPAPPKPAPTPAPVAKPVEPARKAATQPKAVAAKARPIVHERPAPHPAPPPPTPPPAAVVATPSPAPTPAVNTTSNKRPIDGDVFDKKAKRTIDSDVFDDSNAKKPTLDRDNPWKK